MENVYEQLKQLVSPIIEHYQTDLTVYDKRDIEGNPGVPFLHYTRRTGTYIILFRPADTYPPAGELVPYLFGRVDRDHVLDAVRKMAEYFAEDKWNERSKVVYYHDGKGGLKEITRDKALELATEYTRRIRREWREAL